MRVKIGDTRLELAQGDITKQQVGAIVNAANSALSGGGGVDGAIHRAAGPELLAECRTLGRCPTGEARLTKGYELPAKFVIHAVGPVYDRTEKVAEQLASVYRYSLQLAYDKGIKTIAFPAISTGIYGYPLQKAAPIALETGYTNIKAHQSFELVRFVLFTSDALLVFSRALRQLAQNHTDIRTKT